ncbi:MAG TPA: ABC transporter permease [Anaerolineaceae bacterium]|nr:ABC transporter permease [Anaerolineaceae bacterium]
MNAFVHHLSYDFRTGLRDRSLLLLNYLFPLFFYVMMGLIMTQINPTFTQTMVPAMVTFAILSSALLGLPNPIVSARENGIYRSFKINGVPALSILVIPVLGILAHILVVSGIITLTAQPLFDAPLPTQWVANWLLVILTGLSMAGIGLLIGVVAPHSRSVVFLSQAIYLPSMILGGLMMPVEILPKAMGRIALLLPSTHAMNAFRGLAMGLSTSIDPLVSVAALAAGAVITFVLAVYLFEWDDRQARRRPALLALLGLLPFALTAIFFG